MIEEEFRCKCCKRFLFRVSRLEGCPANVKPHGSGKDDNGVEIEVKCGKCGTINILAIS